MTTLQMQQTPTALASSVRSDEISEEADLYGWLLGSWELDVIHYRVNLADRDIKGEAHFARILEGRGVQDVWIMPRREDRSPSIDTSLNMYGTTLRIWDPSIQAWRITWINPLGGLRDELIGRRVGDDIVQLGSHSNGVPIRWIFTDIAANSFHWIGEALEPDAKRWKLEGEFRARRIGS